MLIKIKIMENITKKIEMFVSNFENLTFVRKIKNKFTVLCNHYDNNAFVKKLNVIGGIMVNYMEIAGGYVLLFAKKIVLNYIRLDKYINGRRRVKAFLINNIASFEIEHKKIVGLIESRDIEEPRNWESYLKCKSNVSAILKANRRMRAFNILTDDEETKSYLNEYINHKRFSKKYELST